MDTARYVAALLVLVTAAPAILYWVVVHGFIERWRRAGTAATYVMVVPIYVALMFGMWMLRDLVLTVEYGTQRWLWIPAVISYGIAINIERLCRRHLKLRTLVGVPEVKGESSALLDGGIYGRIRHPRYVGFLFGVTAVAFFANYLAAYVIVLLSVVGIHGIARLEERELLQRFGDHYRQYMARVPRFVPKGVRSEK